MRRPKVGSDGAGFHHGPGATLDEIDVPVTTLDEFLSAHDHSRISFIKCDVEHHELDVFRGGEQTLSEYLPTLLFECHEGQAEDGELFSYLTSLGHDGFFFFVRPSDHQSLLRNNNGKYVHFSEFRDHPYPRPSAHHRNYIFLRNGQQPA